MTHIEDSDLSAQVDDLVDWFVETDETRPATDEEINEFKRRIMALIKSDREAHDKITDLKGSIETAEQIWAIYRAPSRIPGEKMFDFDRWLPGQIEDWKDELAQLSIGEKQ